MQSITQLQPEQLASLQGVLTDIDDTLSTHGKLTPEAYAALWDLYRAGFKIIVVTGRPAGWCDHIARFWPVHAVVGENGGFYFYHDCTKLQRHFLYDDFERCQFRDKLDTLRERILREVPGTGVASDQPYREYDLAIDFCEDVPPLPREDILRIKAIFESAGAHAKISSIHVNGWFGDFDKLTTSRLCLKNLFQVDINPDTNPDRNPDAFAFCGDSPNDQPMFAFFGLSFGMANIEPFLDLIQTPPAYITQNPCGEGFCEVAAKILQSR